MLIKPYSSSRFYKRSGEFAVGATLRDARANGYYPSVTTISNIVYKPALEAWKQNLAWRYVGGVLSWVQDKVKSITGQPAVRVSESRPPAE